MLFYNISESVVKKVKLQTDKPSIGIQLSKLAFSSLANNASSFDWSGKNVFGSPSPKNMQSNSMFKQQTNISEGKLAQNQQILSNPSDCGFSFKNKVQLFNSIRRYSRPSLVSLLRIQMFGTPDYKYRPDELQTAHELLQISEEAYNFIKEEWMIPLPEKGVVYQWSNGNDSPDLC